MEADELIRAAYERSRQLEAKPPEAALDRLRADYLRFFAEVPEPPVYRRAEDPARVAAERLARQAQELLARGLAVARAAGAPAEFWVEAMKAHASALCHTAGGRLEAAEAAWRKGRQLEREAARAGRLWARSDEGAVPVFDPATGLSRYDPRPEPRVKVRLACATPSCRRMDDYSFSPRHPSHRFVCPACKVPFIGYFAEVESCAVDERWVRTRQYRFLLQDVSGGHSRVEFDESGGSEFGAARGDLLAFLYSEERELRAVLNLSSSRLLWITRVGCFLATAAFGEGAPELQAFRAYRDRVLLRSRVGRVLVRGYYLAGPHLAREIRGRPLAARLTKAILSRVHQQLLRSGYL